MHGTNATSGKTEYIKQGCGWNMCCGTFAAQFARSLAPAVIPSLCSEIIGIWRTSDFGLTWQRSFSADGSSFAFSSVHFFPNFQDALAIGSNGVIVKGSWLVNQPVAVSETSSQPEGYRLGLNYPNPFNGHTWIEFSLPGPSLVALTLFDVLGREVATLTSGERGTGTHRVEWNSAANPSGVYFYRLRARAISGGIAGDYVETRKLILLK
jgi:hypothetical protein